MAKPQGSIKDFREHYEALAGARSLRSVLDSKDATQHQVNLVYDSLHDFAMHHFGLQPTERVSTKQYDLAQKVQQEESTAIATGYTAEHLESLTEQLPSGGLAKLVGDIKPVKIEGPHAERHNKIVGVHSKLQAAHELNDKMRKGQINAQEYAANVAKQKVAQVEARLNANKYTAKNDKVKKLWKSLVNEIVSYGDIYALRVGQQLEGEAEEALVKEFKVSAEDGYGPDAYARNNILHQKDIMVNIDQIASVLAMQDKIDADAKKKKK